MKHWLNVLDDALIIGGVTISLSMIQTILGIIILSAQVVLIIVKGILKIRSAIKNKNPKEIEDAINETKGELENLKEKTDGKH